MVARQVRLYVDASAMVKAIVTERESEALLAYLGKASGQVSSRLLIIEVGRAVGRLDPGIGTQAHEILDAIDLLEMDDAISAVAARIPPAGLRSRDAVHLASALSIRTDIDAVVTYDLRLADAARAADLKVVAPA